jgi:hypothetical protein
LRKAVRFFSPFAFAPSMPELVRVKRAYENLPNFVTNPAFLRFSPIGKAMRFLEL